jgi:peroxiredoxin
MSSNGHLPELDSRPQGRREWSGVLSSLVLPLAFFVVLVGGLLYWQNSRGGSNDNGSYGTVALPANKNPTGKSPSAEVGRAAPDFLLSGLNETVIHLSDKQGQPSVVTFFATWCQDCRTQMPVLVEASTRDSADVNFFAINLQEAPGPVSQFASDYGATFPVLMDSDGDVSASWKVGGRGQPLPATFFIDAGGVVRKVVEGPVTATDMTQGVSLITGGRN